MCVHYGRGEGGVGVGVGVGGATLHAAFPAADTVLALARLPDCSPLHKHQ